MQQQQSQELKYYPRYQRIYQLLIQLDRQVRQIELDRQVRNANATAKAANKAVHDTSAKKAGYATSRTTVNRHHPYRKPILYTYPLYLSLYLSSIPLSIPILYTSIVNRSSYRREGYIRKAVQALSRTNVNRTVTIQAPSTVNPSHIGVQDISTTNGNPYSRKK